MSAQPPAAQTAPPAAAAPPPAVVGTREERRAAIFDGMTRILDEAVARHPHLLYALTSETPEIRAANRALAIAVNRFVAGSLPLRRDVRPHFDRAVSTYLALADGVVLLLNDVLNEELAQALRDHPYIDASLETDEISSAVAAYYRERARLLSGDFDPEAARLALFEMVAAYAAASTPEDLPVEPICRPP